ncbi:MAG TPA: tetratricopeptide repeat protein [Verrucomicrobiae bacterium]|nr:tetratricopeptide repeat protein [Verrucomicrobiae bacterium]
MQQSIAISIALLFLTVCFLIIGAALAYRATPEDFKAEARRWLAIWFAQGAAAPAVLWALMNFGICYELPPFFPEIQVLKNSGGPWVPEYLQVLTEGWFIIGSYWCAVTLGWILTRVFQGLEGETRSNFSALGLMSAVGMLLPAGIMLYFGGWNLGGMAAVAMTAPVAGYAPSLLRTKKSLPGYGRAIAHMKFARYKEAEKAILAELEKCPDHFDGWMMLAELYAVRFADLKEAELTILDICGQPRTAPSQISSALHRLADWHLAAGQPESARRVLGMIVQRLRGTHLARMAQLRLNRTPATLEELEEEATPATAMLPALGDRLESPADEFSDAVREEAAGRANRCVEKLRRNPDDAHARDRLARLLAEQLGDVEAGIEQMGLLLDMPGQSEEKRADWLASMAAWHLKYLNDTERAITLLERLIREFPTSAQALAAHRRLALIRANAAQAAGADNT